MQVSVIGNPDDTVVVTVRGDLDDGSDTVLGTTLEQVLDRPAPRVVVDVSGIGFCDSTGLRSFVAGHERARDAGGWLRLAAPGDQLSGLLRVAGLDEVLDVRPSVADALATGTDL
ncbi:STAS domain-containing protein [Amorphoplanes nipponensis]|uniref:Anti-sigma factor antagonist n=1 Tax=Actinoplanes nipponensis TaxID=135950 RepID=A0A919JFG4_9ACTN|nr:STAS domain-containing protein [Actinoplanes nipponensis]GIE48557.1 anti-sigma factor antagonist [Actinoplanes nipponensis]